MFFLSFERKGSEAVPGGKSGKREREKTKKRKKEGKATC